MAQKGKCSVIFTKKTEFRGKLRVAYSKENYIGAKAALETIKGELKIVNESAVGSLEEGLEETLTVQRLGMTGELRRSLSTTNVIESVMAMVGQING